MVEAMTWYYAFGKPKEQIDLTALVRMPTIINRLRGAVADDEAGADGERHRRSRRVRG